ncbi:MAG: AAA family ATPase [Candidatus Methanoplasma sp.]|jgi:predicted ATPase|nr:AAA family ATPase [Candidatus Methanoplasma sp.]
MIQKIYIHNFKSIEDVCIELGKFNIFIGSNASGKSNFVQAFKFIHDCFAFGIDNSVSMQGGWDEIQNANLPKNEKTVIEITASVEGVRWPFVWTESDRPYGAKITGAKYSMTFEHKQKMQVSDNLEMVGELIPLSKKKNSAKNIPVKIIARGYSDKKSELEIINTEGNKELPSSETKPSLFIPDLIGSGGLMPPLNKLIELIDLNDLFQEISIFDITPKNAKKGATYKGMLTLEEDGGNIALVLKDLFKDEGKKKEFHIYASQLIPEIKEIATEDIGDRTVQLKLEENYFEEKIFSGMCLSDGTANILALIYAIYFDKSQPKIIEEPEKNLHPSLIGNLVEMMEDASDSLQIMVTTHSPVMLRYINIENLNIVSRDEKGNTRISKYSSKGEVDSYLLDEFGIDEMMIEGVLGK